MTGPEMRNLLGIALPDPKPVDAEAKQEIIDMLIRVARESSDPDARTDAFQLLTEMGVVTG